MKKLFAALLACLIVFSSFLVCFADGEIISVKNAKYEEGILTFAIANTTKTNISDSMIAFVYDENEVEIIDYMGGFMTGEIKGGMEKDVKVAVNIKDFDEKNPPKIGLEFQYIEEMGAVDTTAQRRGRERSH